MKDKTSDRPMSEVEEHLQQLAEGYSGAVGFIREMQMRIGHSLAVGQDPTYTLGAIAAYIDVFLQGEDGRG